MYMFITKDSNRYTVLILKTRHPDGNHKIKYLSINYNVLIILGTLYNYHYVLFLLL